MSQSFQPPSLEQLAPLLPAYALEGFIAQGGMGAVYKARQKSLDREVAIKVLPPELSADPHFRASFQSEARAMAKLNHPNLVSVYDSGEVNGMLYIVMEFVAGESLYHAAFGKRLDPKEAVRLALGICRGLAHAHEAYIVHRDIKPANILLTPKAEPKIGDFGLAQPEDAKDEGLAMGTMGYTAPEVSANPAASGDPRADIYPVGVILFELLTGQRQRVGSPPPSAVAGTDAALDGIWQRATASQPQTRYRSVQEMADALEQWLRPSTGRAAAPGPSAGPAGGPPRPRQQQQVIITSSSSGGGFGTLVVIVILLIVGYVVWKMSNTPRVITIPAKQHVEPSAESDQPTRAGTSFVAPKPSGNPNAGATIETPFGSRTVQPDDPTSFGSASKKTPSGSSADPSGADLRKKVETVFGSRYENDADRAHVSAVVGTWKLSNAPNRKITIADNGTFTLEDGRSGSWSVKEKGVYRLNWDGDRWMELRQIGDEFSVKTDQFATFRLTREK